MSSENTALASTLFVLVNHIQRWGTCSRTYEVNGERAASLEVPIAAGSVEVACTDGFGALMVFKVVSFVCLV